MVSRRLAAVGLAFALTLLAIVPASAQHDGLRERVTEGFPNVEFPGAIVLDPDPPTPPDLFDEFRRLIGRR